MRESSMDLLPALMIVVVFYGLVFTMIMVALAVSIELECVELERRMADRRG